HMPVWGETLCVNKWHIAEDGGKGSNVSVALGRLGLSTAYIGKVGNDPWGDLGQKWMNDAGVDTTYLYRTDEVATGTGLILIGPDGQNAVIDGDSSSAKLTLEEVTAALDAMKDARMFVAGLEIREDLVLAATRYAKSLGMITALNPSPLPEKPMGRLEFVDYLFINEIEGKYILNVPQDTEIAPRAMLEKVRESYGCEHVIMTMGSEGSAVLSGSDYWTVAPTKVAKIVNTAGAGDGFLAASVAQLLLGKSLREATEWASKYAALSITIEGTIPAYRPMDEVERFIATLHEA
ncbi:MAG: ribokinase, partial [Ruthenibacterium sp.]